MRNRAGRLFWIGGHVLGMIMLIMSTREMIEQVLAELPEPQQREVYDFVCFLKLKSVDDSFNGIRLSESALAKEWNTPEEDAAWANL
jgi:hypothetical protein